MREKQVAERPSLEQIGDIMVTPRDSDDPPVLAFQRFQVAPEHVCGVHVVVGDYDAELRCCFRDICLSAIKECCLALYFPPPVPAQFLHDIAALVETLDVPVYRPLILLLNDIGEYSVLELCAVRRLEAVAKKGISLWLGVYADGDGEKDPVEREFCGDGSSFYRFIGGKLAYVSLARLPEIDFVPEKE